MHNHLRHLVVNFLVSKLFTCVGPRAAFVIRIVENSHADLSVHLFFRHFLLMRNTQVEE